MCIVEGSSSITIQRNELGAPIPSRKISKAGNISELVSEQFTHKKEWGTI
jgi:hypothetical protein